MPWLARSVSIVLASPIVITLTGFASGLALIIAIGAQNAFVLRQGLRREHIWWVVAVCALSDAVLILAGTAGIGVIIERAPVALDIVRWLGVAFLTGYGLLALWRARNPEALDPATNAPQGRAGVLARALALTWLNPHVYLDTVVLLGSMANQQGPGGRWIFGGGAVVASLVWFSALGGGARYLSRWFTSPRAWRVLEIFVGTVMLLLALRLALG